MLSLTSLLLTACETRNFSTVIVKTPDVVPYSPEVMHKAADEIESLGPMCPREIIIPGCSAAHRMVHDYREMRNQARALQRKGSEEP